MINWLRSAVILLAVAGTAACGGRGREYSVVADSAFTAQERAEIGAGVTRWKAMVPITSSVVEGRCSGVADGVLCLHRSTLAEIAAVESANGISDQHAADAIGLTKTKTSPDGSLNCLDCVDGAETWLAMDSLSVLTCSAGYDPTTNPECALRTGWEHEMGHGMGLKHWYDTASEEYVMDPVFRPGKVVDVTEGDARQWWSLR